MRFVFLILLTLASTAFAESNQPKFDGSWKLKEIRAGTQRTKVGAINAPTIKFEKGEFYAVTGCVKFTGSYTGNNIDFDSSIASRLACKNYPIAKSFINVLAGMNNVFVNDDDIIIASGIRNQLILTKIR